MCLYPRLVQNRKYTPNQKNGGKVPEIYDKRALATPAICGDCMECRKQKAREWQVRLMEDIKTNKGGQMVTLTFSTDALRKIAEDERIYLERSTGEIIKCKIKDLDGYDRDNAIATRAMRLFNERWRKKYKKAIRHWMITELGHQNTEHIHLHGIVWGDVHEVERIWQYGWVYKGEIKNGRLENYVNGKTINYMIKYVSKMDMQHQAYKPIVLCSKGIGGQFTKQKRLEQKFNYENTKEYYRTETGHKVGMPTYWRNKIYTEEQREAMWMHKLDQNIRWVDGQKIDLNRVSEKQYWEALKDAQEKSKKLGYKDGTKKWKREKYERERRNLIWEYRLKMGVKQTDHQ